MATANIMNKKDIANWCLNNKGIIYRTIRKVQPDQSYTDEYFNEAVCWLMQYAKYDKTKSLLTTYIPKILFYHLRTYRFQQDLNLTYPRNVISSKDNMTKLANTMYEHGSIRLDELEDIDRICSISNTNPYDDIDDGIDKREVFEYVMDRIYPIFTRKQKRYFDLRFNKDFTTKRTIRSIADEFGIKHQSAYCIEESIIDKIQRRLDGKFGLNYNRRNKKHD